ncbi:hypothetical protein SCHPADRAFT_887981 [Schizopora paradoxa]|uniref:Uncharacterized protein n=1 Tax=Schizopora paradoxa TaxID=27342 RepID=A0A0H2RWK1_9AGAM|nr:hypothetical protein SCHPADRAFT_887981 [Schizopora paradoxa]
MSKYSNKQKSDSNNARFGGVYYEEQRSAPASRDWLSDYNVQSFDSDDLRDWISATRRQLGTQAMALVVARGLKSMNIAQPPLKSSSHSHSNYSNSNYSHGYSDGYGNNKTRARSVSVEPAFGRMDSKGGKYNGSSQQVYGSNGYSNQQWSNAKSNDPYAFGESNGNTAKHTKGYQTSEYPTSYPSYPMTSNGKKSVPNAYMYDQSRTDNYHYGGVQQMPYAQQASYPATYEDHSSRTSDSSQYGGGSFKE